MFPIFFENSKVPDLLSKIAPFKVGGVAFFLFVWTRGVASPRLRAHEITHWKQQVEGLFAVQWALYAIFWAVLLIFHSVFSSKSSMSATYLAYRMSPFEIEAYDNQSDPTYNDQVRKPYAWVKYVPRSFERMNDA